MLALTLIGGTDLPRFVTFFHIPLIVIIASRLQTPTPRVLIIGLVISLLIFNRIPLPIPQHDYNLFLDFYGAYHDRINPSTITRWQELVVWLFLPIGIQGGLAIREREQLTRQNTSVTSSDEPTNKKRPH